MKTMVRPSSRRRRAMPKRVSTSRGVSGAVGSSMMMSRLSEASARAISTICWSAIERPRIGLRHVDRDAEQVHVAARLAGHLGPRHAAEPALVGAAEDEVLGDREIGEGDRLLVDQRDAELLRRDRVGDLDRLAVEREGAARRAVDAREDLREGRFARAVLAEQRVDLAAPQVEVDIAQHLDAREGL